MTVIAEISEHFPLGYVDGEFGDAGRSFKLMRPFAFVDGEIKIEAPSGFVTDFNSVPRIFWSRFPPSYYPAAGVIHDYLYRNPHGYTRGEVDGIHNRIMEIEGASWRLRRLVRLGLWLGGWVPWGKYREAEAVKGYAGPKDAA